MENALLFNQPGCLSGRTGSKDMQNTPGERAQRLRGIGKFHITVSNFFQCISCVNPSIDPLLSS